MNIVYACDNNFAEIMGVSITSLFETNKGVSEIIVYVIEDSINVVNRVRLQQLAEQYGRTIQFLDKGNVFDNFKLNQDRGSLSTFSRLFLSQLIPQSCDRILYLDCDVLIRHNIEELYNQNFEGNIVCGVLDCISKQHRVRIKFGEDEKYINAGVLLVDMTKWRAADVESIIADVINEYKGKVPYADQGILNIALRDKVKLVHPKFNCMTIFTSFGYEELLTFRLPSACESSVNIKEAKEDPSIVHFITLFCERRPWEIGSKCMYCQEWRDCKARSLWANDPYRVKRKKKSLQIISAMYKILPKFVTLPIIGILHSRVKPLLMK